MMLSPGTQQFVVAQGSPNSDSSAQLDRLIEVIQELHDQIDETQFDLEELSFELAFEDADYIIEYLRQNIDFEAYEGLLRGAEGTLISRAGNALDRALLGAQLLNSAGYETQIQRGVLAPEQAELLLKQIKPRVSLESSLDGSNFLEELGIASTDLATLSTQATDSIESITNEVKLRANQLLQDLENASLNFSGTDLLIEEVQDYFWLEYRLGDSDSWQASHIAFDAPIAIDISPTETFTDSIPEELQHRVRYQVFVEQKLGDDLESHAITEAWERPVANTVGLALSYANMPDGLNAVENPQDLLAVTEATNFYYPLFEDELLSNGKAFDLEGFAVPVIAASDPMAAIFQTTGEKAGEAAGMLGSLGGSLETTSTPAETAAEFVALSAQWIEFTLISPGGDEEVHKRMIVDRIGADNRSKGLTDLTMVDEAEVHQALQTSHTFMLAPGHFSEPYVLEKTLSSILALQEYLRQVSTVIEQGGELPKADNEVFQSQDALLHLSLYSVFGDFPVSDTARSYYSKPGLVVHTQSHDQRFRQVDIVSNPRRSLDLVSESLPQLAPQVSLEAGIWESRFESAPLERNSNSVEVVSAYKILGDLSQSSTAIVAIESNTIDKLNTLRLPAESLAAIQEDLERGYVVLAPEALPDEAITAAWWRIHPETGETLARGGDGRGQTFIEYLATFEVSSVISAGFAVYGVSQCEGMPPRQAGCCIIQNVVLAAGGFALGAVLALQVAKFAVLLDFGWNIGTFFIPTVCSADSCLPTELPEIL